MEEVTRLLNTEESSSRSTRDGISNNQVTGVGLSEQENTDDFLNSNVRPVSKIRMGLVLASCFYLLFSIMGMFSSLGVIYVELIEHFDSPRSDAALVQSLFSGFGISGGILFTNLILKFNVGIVLALSSVLTAAGCCASAFSPNIQTVIALLGAVAGLTSSIGRLVAYVVVSWTFQERRKAALAVLVMGGAAGQIVFPYVTTALISRVFWSDTVIIIGALLFLNCIPCGVIFYYSSHIFQKGDSSKQSKSKLIDRHCLTDVAFIAFLIPYIAMAATANVEQSFVVDMATVKGFAKEAGASLLSLNGIMLLIGRFGSMVWLGFFPSIKLERHMAYLSVCTAAGHILVSESSIFWGMVLGIILRGFSVGIVFAFIPGLQMDLRGLELFPQTLSLCNCFAGVAGIVGAFLGGLSFDRTGSYSLIFSVAAGISVLYAAAMILITIVFRHRSHKKNKYDEL